MQFLILQKEMHNAKANNLVKRNIDQYFLECLNSVDTEKDFISYNVWQSIDRCHLYEKNKRLKILFFIFDQESIRH